METKNNFRICDDSFGYLMFLLNKNKHFSELHLPSLDKIKIDEDEIIMEKKIPIEFAPRILEMYKIADLSKKTNIIFFERRDDKKNIYLVLKSKLGEILSPENLSNSNKNEIIKLFFDYHQEINCENVKTNYEAFFNPEKLQNDIKIIIRNMPKNKSKFDKEVLDFFNLISSFHFKKIKNKKRTVHGDFILRNIVYINGDFSVIDLDMVHEGYLEIQFVRLLKELYGFATKDFFINLNENSFQFENLNYAEMFELYLMHKILDLSSIKSAYLTNKEKYSQLQNHVRSQIRFITDLIKRRGYFKELFIEEQRKK